MNHPIVVGAFVASTIFGATNLARAASYSPCTGFEHRLGADVITNETVWCDNPSWLQDETRRQEQEALKEALTRESRLAFPQWDTIDVCGGFDTHSRIHGLCVEEEQSGLNISRWLWLQVSKKANNSAWTSLISVESIPSLHLV
jgi:hypothetical protein